MAGETTITINGNLTADPEIRFTSTGVPVTAFTVASSPRLYDQGTGVWKDGDALFLRCSAWRELAEHAAESLRRGTRVIVTGRLKQRSYETAEGEKRTVYEVDADDVGPSLKFATTEVRKAGRDKVPHPADTTAQPGHASAATDTPSWDSGGNPPF